MRPGRFHPGNPPLTKSRLVALAGFNEAGAFPPRKCDREHDLLARVGPASMRPGRFHPGNPPLTKSRLVALAGFNEAGAFPPRKSARLAPYTLKPLTASWLQ